MNRLKKEIVWIVGIFLFLAIGMHFKEWLSHPIEHILHLPTAGAYGLGAIHPLIFTFLGYVVVYPFRALFRRFRKKKD